MAHTPYLQLDAELYRTAIESHLDILVPLFSVKFEPRNPFPDGKYNADGMVILLTRKPLLCINLHRIESTWSIQSTLFDKRVRISMAKQIKIGIVIPHSETR